MKNKTLKPSNYINFDVNEPDGRNAREPQCYTGVFEDWDGHYGDFVALDFVYFGDNDYNEATQLKAAKLYIKQHMVQLYNQYQALRMRDLWDKASIDCKDELLKANGADWSPDISLMINNEGQQRFLLSLNKKETKYSLYKKLCKYAISQNANYSGELL